MQIKNHLLTEATFIPSPNYDERPQGCVIDLLVIHNISLPPNEFGGGHIVDFFCNRLDPNAHPYFATIIDLKVSAHLFLRRQGEIIQFVPFNQRAWHSGVSQFRGREKCNDFSIGIELEGADEVPYTKIQYERLRDVTDCLCKHYPNITLDRIVGHSEVSPDRKTDPGAAFDWDRYKKLLKENIP